MKRIFSALSESETMKERKLIVQLRSLFQSFLGDSDPEEIQQEKGNLLKIHVNGKPGLFYWNTFYSVRESLSPASQSNSSHLNKNERNESKGSEQASASDDGPVFAGGMIAVIEEANIPQGLSIKRWLREANQSAKSEELFGVLDFSSASGSYPIRAAQPFRGVSFRRLKSQVLRMKSLFQRHEKNTSSMISILPLDGNRVAYAMQPIFSFFEQAKKNTTFSSVMFYVLLVFLALFLSSKMILQFIPLQYFSSTTPRNLDSTAFSSSSSSSSSSSANVSPSHASAVVGYFLLSLLLPVGSFVFLGYQYSEDRHSALVQEKYFKLGVLLRMVDDNFLLVQNKLQDVYVRLTKHPAFLKQDPRKIQILSDYLRKKNLASSVFLGDKNGNIIPSPSRKTNDMGSRIIPTVVRKIFARKNPGTGGIKNLLSDAMVDSFADGISEVILGTNSKKSLENILENPGQVKEVKLGSLIQYFFADFIPSLQAADQNILIFLQPKRDLVRFYIQWILKNNQKTFKKMDFTQIGAIENFDSKQILPHEFSKYPFLRSIYKKVLKTQSQVSGHFEIADESFLVTAAPMSQFSDYIIFAIYPENRISDHLFGLRRNLLFLVLLSLIIAGFSLFKLALARVGCQSQALPTNPKN
ncbi:MAG: hypothetical protein WA705_31850 [Candidatus Ozemobacteraceae bacterium]